MLLKLLIGWRSIDLSDRVAKQETRLLDCKFLNHILVTNIINKLLHQFIKKL
jgi:hypothetical protein